MNVCGECGKEVEFAIYYRGKFYCAECQEKIKKGLEATISS